MRRQCMVDLLSCHAEKNAISEEILRRRFLLSVHSSNRNFFAVIWAQAAQTIRDNYIFDEKNNIFVYIILRRGLLNFEVAFWP